MKKQLPLFVILLVLSNSLFAQPTINTFSPASGPVGTTVTISGSGFSATPADNTVFFGAVKATVLAASSTAITISVPAGATYQPITVTTNYRSAYSAKPFIVTFTNSTGGFTPGTFPWVFSSATDANPYAQAIGDLDNDGKPDIVTANYTGNSFSVLKNTSTPGEVSMAAKVDFPCGSGPYSIALGDLTGDGKQDVVVVNYNDNNLSVFVNTSTNGSISFATPIICSTGNSPVHIAIGDLDGDRRPDLAVCHLFDIMVSLYRNTGSAAALSFAAKTDYNLSSGQDYLAIGDLNKDGKPDIMSGSLLLQSITVLKNESSPGIFSFSKGNPQSVAQFTTMAIGDLDGDDKPDIVTSNNHDNSTQTDFITVLQNVTTGNDISFANRIQIPTTGRSTGVAIGDLDGDSKPDLALAMGSGIVALLKNNGSPGTVAFTTALEGTEIYPSRVSLCDMDGDGKTDIVSSSLLSTRVNIQRNAINEPAITSFTPTRAGPGETVTINGINFTGATAVKFGGVPATSYSIINATTITAIVGSGATGQVSVTTGYGTDVADGFKLAGPPVILSFTPTSGTLGTVVTIKGSEFTGTTAVSFGGIAATSFTVEEDTIIKAVAGAGASGQITVTNSYGTGSMAGFTHLAPRITSFTPTAAGVGEYVTINGINFTDATAVNFGSTPVLSFTILSASVIKAMVGGGSTGDVSVVTPFGTASKPGFAFTAPPPPVITSFSPAKGNIGTTVIINGSNFSAVPAENIVYFGATRATVTAAGTSQLKVTVPAGASNQPISVLVSNNGLTAYSAQPFHITFSGGIDLDPYTFADPLNISLDAETYPLYTKVADLDNDGKPDIIASSRRGILVFRNKSTKGSLSYEAPSSFTGLNPLYIAVADLDGDSKPDLVCATNTRTVYILRNTSTTGNISFAAPHAISTFGDSQQIGIGDLDGDGKPDIVVSNYNTYSISIFRNTCAPGTISFDLKSDIVIGGTATAVAIGDLDDDGKVDLVVSNNNPASSLAIFRNTSVPGSISLAPSILYTVGEDCNSLAIADLNADNKPEIIASHWRTVTIYKNTGSAGNLSFGDQVDYATSGIAMDLGVDDINGDGMIDLVVANDQTNSGSLGLFQNKSTGTALSFAPETRSQSGVPWSMAVNDQDGDGRPDAVLANVNWSIMAVFRNQNGTPVITNIDPAVAPEGATVTITGYGLTKVNAVSFGDSAAASFTVHSPTTITAVVGKGSSGSVVVKTPTGSASFNYFTFAGVPVITSFSPASATTNGHVTIEGVNLQAATAVSFGGVPVSYWDVGSPTTLRVIIGNGATGEVKVVTPGGTATLGGFTFMPPPPYISSISPGFGVPGTSVTITGRNFTGTTAVKFGNIAAASFTVKSSTVLEAVLGAGETGPITVANAAGSAEHYSFLVIDPPTITSFSPSSAGTGALLTIKGSHLSSLQGVTLGGVPVTYFDKITDTMLIVKVAQGASGDIVVKTSGGGVATFPGFVFVPAPSITSFTPAVAATGDTILVTGINLSDPVALTFGDVPAAKVMVDDAAHIRAVVGTGATGAIQLSTIGGTASMPGFTYKIITALPDIDNDSRELAAHPNPSHGRVLISHPSVSRKALINWIDLSGRITKVTVLNRNTSQTEADIKNLSPGIYKIVWSDGIRQITKSIMVY